MKNFLSKNLSLITEIIKCFICLDLNTKKWKIFNWRKHLNPTNGLVWKFYKELRNIIHRYMYFVYNSELFGEVN